MDTVLLWELIQKNCHHIEVINRELGQLVAQMEWITWTIRGVFGVLVVSVILNSINIWLTKRNGKKS